jgi:Thiopurine S-methyltransferase (TPMT)
MTAVDPDEQARMLATESLAGDDPTGWFERLYAAAAEGEAVVPWDRGGPHPLLVDWAQAREPTGSGRRALVVGAGLGADAEYIAGLGFETVAFDVAATAVQTARGRFPHSAVDYLVADLLDPPAGWSRAFDLVFESLTVQALPRRLRREAIEAVRELVAPGGTLLVVAAVLGDRDDPDAGPPWPLTRADVEAFVADGLEPVQIEDIPHPEDPSVHRWRAEFVRRQ